MRPRDFLSCPASTRLLWLLLACAATVPAAVDRFFDPTPGYARVRDLPDSLRGAVSRVEFRVHDAFEGSETHSGLERAVYDIGNRLHIDTREATLRRRLPFRAGDTVSIDVLRETEKNLRAEEFLADAIVEVRRLPDSTFAVMVTSYDQWSTALGVSLGRQGGEWTGWIGPVESNLLGTGQRVGFFLSHDLERDSRFIDYSNTAFTSLRLRLLAQYAWLSDGSSYAFSVTLPFRTRGQRWGFSVSASGNEFAESEYLSGNALDRLAREDRLDSAGQRLFGRTNVLGQWERTRSQSLYFGVTRAFGSALKVSVTPFYQRDLRDTVPGFAYLVPTSMLATRDSLGIPAVRPDYDVRRDEVLGATFSIYRYAFKTVHNFRNLKWSENIETGWRLSLSAGRNQSWLGARDDATYLAYTGVYNDAWRDALFVNTSASLRHFVDGGGRSRDGSASMAGEAQWKPVPPLATVLTASYTRTFANPDAQPLYLGEESGLLGYPNFYYAGRQRLLLAAEQRFFPPVEFGTLVPALAVFVNAGDAWDEGRRAPGDLHYAAGVGLRLGATRSVQKVVNHINLTWPLGERHLDGPVFGIRAAKSL